MSEWMKEGEKVIEIFIRFSEIGEFQKMFKF